MSEEAPPEGYEIVKSRRPIQQRKPSFIRRILIDPVEQITRPPNKKMERS